MSDENFKNLKIIVEYLLDSEQRNYEEYIANNFENIDSTSLLSKETYNRPEINHIYAITRRLKDSLDLQL